MKFHSLKHSIATHLLDAGADLAFVKDWLGHANIQTLSSYAQLTSTARDQQARKLFASPRVAEAPCTLSRFSRAHSYTRPCRWSETVT